MNDTEKKIWSYLINYGMTPAGAAGMMGNLYAESGCRAVCLENLCIRRYKERKGITYTSESYRDAVDSGEISREEFLRPMGLQYGWGIYQVTSPSRKAGLYDLCKNLGVSIGDLPTQLDYLIYELRTNYQTVLTVLTTTNDIRAASNIVLQRFEQPADTGPAVQQVRYSYAKDYYDAYHEEKVVNMDAIKKVIGIAEQEIGYLEKKSNADLDSKTGNAGSGNYTKYWRDVYPQYQGQPYCACFVSWVLMVAFGLEAAKKLLQHWPFVYCPTLAGKTSNKVPKVGSIGLFFRSGAYAHTGIVTAVTDSTITVIEGNTSGASGIVPNGGGVCKKTYQRASLSPMTKYFMPDYSIVKESEDMMYYVRSAWLDTGSQTYKGIDLEKAKAASKKNKQLYVFDALGKIVYPVHKTVEARIERAVLWENAVQKDPRHGYDNTEGGRWGQHGDYACSTLQITAYQQAGVPVKTKGATVTANMRDAFIAAGFKDVTKDVNFSNCAGMLRGDVLITPGRHTEMYIGGKRLIGARGNAYGDGPEHGKPGDQGGEIVKSAYFNNPWVFCLRYVGLPKTKRVQCGSFQKKANAVDLQTKIKQKTGITTVITKIDTWYTVRTKAMTEDEARDTVSKLKKAGFTDVAVI